MTSPRLLPIVYLPGVSGRGEVWAGVAERLRVRRPPVLVDYPGAADRVHVPGVDSVTALVRHLSSRLPPVADFAALSAGAAVALRFALEEPARIRRLVLVTPAAGVDARRFGGLDFRPAYRARHPSAPRYLVDDATDLAGPELARITTPTLIVVGGRDAIAPPAVGEHLSRSLPNARLELLEDATHDLETEYTTLLASLIEQHLRREG